jgi:hypothetical protein
LISVNKGFDWKADLPSVTHYAASPIKLQAGVTFFLRPTYL